MTRPYDSRAPPLCSTVKRRSKEWLDIVNGLRTKQPDNAEELANVLSALRGNNAKWMNVGATQFAKSVSQYCRME